MCTKIKQDFYGMSFDRKIIGHHIQSILCLLLPYHINPTPWSPGRWVWWPFWSWLVLRSLNLATWLCWLATVPLVGMYL